MQYTVFSSDSNGRDTVIEPNLNQHKAIELAVLLARCPRNGKIYIGWFRKSDCQFGYLNSTGHDIIGRAW